MCGIAGYSIRSRSSIGRTLAAQAFLAAIAERGADAVGYAYRAAGDTYATVVKQRTPLHNSSNGCPCPTGEPAARPRARLHEGPSFDLRQQPSGSAWAGGRHPQRDHPERRRAARPPLLRSSRTAHDRRLGGDLRAGSALAERRARARESAWRDGDLLAGRARTGRRLPRPRQRPPAVDRRGPRRCLLRFDEGCAGGRRALLRAEVAQTRVREGTWLALEDGRVARRAASGPTSRTTKIIPSLRCAHRRSGSSASLASRRSPPFRRSSRRPRRSHLPRAAAHARGTGTSPRRRGGPRTGDRPAIP